MHCNEYEPDIIHAARGLPSPQGQLGPVKGNKRCPAQLRRSQGRIVCRGEPGAATCHQDKAEDQANGAEDFVVHEG
jgi:hypothetical protein